MKRVIGTWAAAVFVLATARSAGAQVTALLVGNQSGFAGLDSYAATNGSYLGVFASGNGSGSLNQFNFFRYGPDNNLYIEQGPNVLKYNGHTGSLIGTFTSVPGDQFTFGPDGNMYRLEPASQTQTNPLQVGKYDGQTGARLSTFVPSNSSGLSNSFQNMRFGPNGNLFIDDGNRLLQFDGATGAPVGVFVPQGSGGLVTVDDFLFASNGRLLISGGSGSTVLAYDALTGAFTGTFASGNGLNVPLGLAEGSDGNIYVASEFSQSIKRFNLTTGTFAGDFVPMTTSGRFPSYLEFTPFPVPEPTGAIFALVVGCAAVVRRACRKTNRTSQQKLITS